MTYNKSQQNLRLARIVTNLKRNVQVNTQTLSRDFKMHEDEPGAPRGCSTRTIARDMEHLKDVLGAPIEFDPGNQTYVLTDPNWRFTCPVFEDDFVNMSMLGVQLAEDIVPDPLRGELDRALSQTLTSNSSDFFDEAMMDTILVASGVKSHIDPGVFKSLFDAWRQRLRVRLSYVDPQGKASEHVFEPHLIVFFKGNWYAKGYLAKTKTVRVFACQRITGVEPICEMFQRDRKLLDDTRKNGVFDYPKLAGIKLRCDASIAFYIHEQQKKFQSKIERQPDGSLVLSLHPTVEHEVLKWILSEGGRIQVLEPLSLREKVAEAGRNITLRNS